MKNLFTLLLLVLASLSLSAQVSVPADQYPSDVARDWMNLELYLAKTGAGYTPPVMARVEGYTGLALYQALVSGLNNYSSLEGHIPGLSNIAAANPDTMYHWPTVANNALATIVDSLFGNATSAKKDSIHAHKNMWNTLYAGQISTQEFNNSMAFGVLVAQEIFDYSKTDGGHQCYLHNNDVNYVPPVCPSCWVPTPPAFALCIQPHWGSVRPFVEADTLAPVIPTDPPAFSTDTTSLFYAYVHQVYITKNNLTNQQKNIAKFWADGSGSITPPGHSLSILTQILKRSGGDLGTATLGFAKLGLAEDDAFIACWKAKYIYNLIRPITYINTYIDPTWTAVIPTPPFPEYTSGHSTQSGAMSEIMNSLYGSSYAYIDSTYITTNGGPRTFTSFDEAAYEAATSRMFAGIHYEFSDVIGLSLGKMVGNNINDLFESVHYTCSLDPTIMVTGDTTFCEGGSTTLTASPMASGYMWSTGDTTQSITVMQSGTYMVTVSYGVCGDTTNSVAVTVYSAPALNLGADNTTCGPVTLNAGAGYTYLWSTGATTQSITASTTGNYAVTITDGSGCTNWDDINLFIGSGMTVNLGPDDATCSGSAVTLDAGPGFDSYMWSTGATTQTISVSNAGDYHVTTTDGNGCTSNDLLHLSVYTSPTTPTITQTDNTLYADPGFAFYDWYKDGSFESTTVDNYFNLDEGGTFTVTVRDANDCGATSADFSAIFNGIESVGNSVGFSVYPNPTINYMIITSKTAVSHIDVYDMSGKQVLTSTNPYVLDLFTVSAGSYLIKVYNLNNKLLTVKKIVKQ